MPRRTGARADAILGMVENRFGKPTAGEGDNARLWNLGSIIVATQYSPENKQNEPDVHGAPGLSSYRGK